MVTVFHSKKIFKEIIMPTEDKKLEYIIKILNNAIKEDHYSMSKFFNTEVHWLNKDADVPFFFRAGENEKTCLTALGLLNGLFKTVDNRGAITAYWDKKGDFSFEDGTPSLIMFKKTEKIKKLNKDGDNNGH